MTTVATHDHHGRHQAPNRLDAPSRLVLLGCGSVTQCLLPILLAESMVRPSQVTVLDMIDNRPRIADALRAGVRYEVLQITPENLDIELGSRLSAGDLCIDLAWNIDTVTLLEWCRERGVRYLNTSVEVWDPYEDAATRHPLDRTLYVRHLAMRKVIAGWGDNRGPSAVVEHGANPGLVSHLAKLALSELAAALLAGGHSAEPNALEAALAEEHFARVAELAGVKVIHVSERDTQVANIPKQLDEFVNTWSVDGFYEEGIAPAELGWGTHERALPPFGFAHVGEGPRNQICLARPGAATFVRSWVPTGEIIGMVIRHGEAFTMSDHLTVWDGDIARYRPTVHYAYCPSADAIASMYELQMRQWDLQPAKRIMNDEIISGRDDLGVLLMGHPLRSWWTGSRLTIGQARALVPGQSATTVQVAASVMAAISWMIGHPSDGVRVPDELPWRELLEVTAPYLGPLWSAPVDWDPLRTRVRPFSGFDGRVFDVDDPWQFTNFLVDGGT